MQAGVMQARARNLWEILKRTVQTWQGADSPRMAAALSYYTVFSLAPLIVLVTVIAGVIFGQRTVRDQILAQVATDIGKDAAQWIAGVIDQISQPRDSIVSTVLSLVALLLGAAGVFGQLQASLDRIWGVASDKMPQGVRGFLFNQLVSFGMLLAVGFLLLASLIVSTILSAVGVQFDSIFSGGEFVVGLLNFALSFAVITLLFALMFRLLPHTDIAWHDVWGGAALTALLFTVGKTLLSFYLGRSGTASIYGAAGSLVVILLWIYYVAQVWLFGAAFTSAYAHLYGSRVEQERKIRERRVASPASKMILANVYERLLSDRTPSPQQLRR